MGSEKQLRKAEESEVYCREEVRADEVEMIRKNLSTKRTQHILLTVRTEAKNKGMQEAPRH